MAILVWTERDVSGMEGKEVRKVLTEVDERGEILREIGLDADERVLYIAPAKRGKHPYGLFDLQVIDVGQGLRNEFPQEKFEELWSTAAPEFVPRADRTVSGGKGSARQAKS